MKSTIQEVTIKQIRFYSTKTEIGIDQVAQHALELSKPLTYAQKGRFEFFNTDKRKMSLKTLKWIKKENDIFSPGELDCLVRHLTHLDLLEPGEYLINLKKKESDD
jgi:hypothetical protein